MKRNLDADCWAQTAALKALALSEVIDAAGWAAADQLNVIGATLAQGKDVYSGVLHDHTRFDSRWFADLSAHTIWIGTGALERLGPPNESVRVDTAFSARHHELQQRWAADTEQWQREHNIVPEGRRDSFSFAHAVVDLDDTYRERLFLLVDSDTELGPATQVVESFGGEIVAGPEFSQGGVEGLINGAIFTIKRRSAAPAAEYLAKHTSLPI